MVQEGYYLPVIHRNTTIPVSREEVVATVERNQRQVRVRIFQGEGRRVEDNLLLGELMVTGLPPAPPGLAVHLRFTYDLNGILEVEAYVPESGQKYRTVLHRHVKGLSPKEIDRAVKNLQKLKFYPRDDLRNQQLIRYAERVVGEVNPHERQVLEDRIDALEHAMASCDREQFEAARRDLLILLSELGFPADDPTESGHENP
jgi:molecular chaperone HscC